MNSLPFRIGHGYDIHRLRESGRLVLGGVIVSEQMSPIAHSDGDVVIHAIVDALLGAMGWGDIGEHFADSDPRWKGQPSRIFLDPTVQRVRAAGYALGNCDVTIMAERPRLKAHKAAMKASLAAMLGVSEDRVNVKAGTNEECDAVGRGEAIAAHAVVLLRHIEPAPDPGQRELSNLESTLGI
jgi:2-C-methyl-D-erythritol 2,4-cyclodiphosphate synthase